MTVGRGRLPGGSRARPLVAVITAVVVAGCAEGPFADGTSGTSPGPRDVAMVAASYQATERLLRTAQQPLGKDRPVLVASLVNVANLTQSSNLGRIISEQVATRLVQLGYEIREPTYRGTVLVKEGGGQFVLSRRLQDVSREQEAQAVIAGVYAVARRVVFVTLRAIRAADGTVIASYDYTLPLGPDTAALLGPWDQLDY